MMCGEEAYKNHWLLITQYISKSTRSFLRTSCPGSSPTTIASNYNPSPEMPMTQFLDGALVCHCRFTSLFDALFFFFFFFPPKARPRNPLCGFSLPVNTREEPLNICWYIFPDAFGSELTNHLYQLDDSRFDSVACIVTFSVMFTYEA